jgi:hypothetical protein
VKPPGCPSPHRPGRWTSFVADVATAHTLLIHLSDEDGDGWTTFAVDRESRRCTVAQGRRQPDTAREAYERLYDLT